MYILDICENGDVLSVFKIVNLVILLIKIIVPIGLIVSVMIEYLKAVMNHDEIAITNKLFVNKIMAAVLVFLIPTFVNLVISSVDPKGISYAGCLENATNENINAAYVKTANKRIDAVKDSLLTADYQIAMSSVNKIKDESAKTEVKTELEGLKESVDLYADLDKLSQDYDRDKYLEYREKIGAIQNKEIKEKLEEKLSTVIKTKNNIGDFDIDPNSGAYSGLKELTGITLKEVLEKNGSSVEELEQKIHNAVYAQGVGTREAAVAAGMTLYEEIAKYGYAIKYDWGGKLHTLGVNGSWGEKMTPQYCGSHPRPSYCRSTYIYKGFDCTGFVDWAISQARQKVGSHIYDDGTYTSLNSQKAVCQIGDTLESNSHAVLIVGIDESRKSYVVLESTPQKMKTSYYSFGKSGYWCNKIKYIN